FLPEADFERSDLARSRADIEVGADAPSAADILSEIVGVDRLVVVMRRGHPLAADTVTLEQFAAIDHVSVSRRGRLSGAIDDLLATQGLHRRVIAAMPAAAAALAVVAGSDAVAVVADRTSALVRADLALVSRPLPFETPGIPAVMSWHRRDDSDLAHRWLRDRIAATLRTALRPEVQPGSAVS
uniref:LysR substrate-binding domain-containing protein n=1 Tax=uncultured Amnibacterium sp. TaxID=1631851 RepID=UPI0035CC7F0A